MGQLAGVTDFAVNARKPRAAHPKGWEPGFEWDGRKGFIVAEPGKTAPQFETLLAELCAAIGEDPAHYEIVGDIQVRRWQQSPGDDYLYYHRATIALRSGSTDTDPDVDALCARVSARKPRRGPTPHGNAGLVVAVADIQIGKSDGDGVEGTMQRLDNLIGQVEDQWKRVGKPSIIYPCFLGDLFESCAGHYAQQQFRTVLNIRDQRKVLRWFIDSALDRWSKLAPLGVKVVGGNHGEERDGGKSHTDFADNRDVAVVEDVAYAYAKQPDRYGHVSFAIPNDDLTLTFDHEGLVIGLAHGHQAGFGSGDPRTKIHNWWRGQMDGQQPVGDADILVTGHFHHPWMIRRGARTHFGCPALDGGSDWFRNQTGQTAPPGALTFTVTSEGWSDMQILGS